MKQTQRKIRSAIVLTLWIICAKIQNVQGYSPWWNICEVRPVMAHTLWIESTCTDMMPQKFKQNSSCSTEISVSADGVFRWDKKDGDCVQKTESWQVCNQLLSHMLRHRRTWCLPNDIIQCNIIVYFQHTVEQTQLYNPFTIIIIL